jgi:hypothetical protein
MVVNGFEFSSRLVGTPQCFHIAKCGDVVYTSKDMNYLIRKVKSTPPVGRSEFKNGVYVSIK